MKLTSLALACFLCLIPVVSAAPRPAPNEISNGRQPVPWPRPKPFKISTLINAYGKPFELTYADPNNTIVNAWGPDYTPTDFLSSKSLMDQDDDPSIPDSDFFEFTEANLQESNQAAFYAIWSIEIQKDPKINLTEVGEWNLFNQVWLGNKNFLCSFDTMGCHNMMSLRGIREMYPHRPHARVIYFTLQQFEIYHNTAVATESQFSRAQLNLIGYVSPMIRYFTRQPEPSRENICRIIRQTLRTAADVGFQMAASGIASAPIPNFEVVFTLQPNIIKEQLWRWWNPDSYSGFKNFWFASWKKNNWAGYIAMLKGCDAVLPNAFAVTFNPMMSVAQMTPMWLQQIFNEHVHKLTLDLGLDQGYGKGAICGAFRGDEQDRSPQNMAKLMQFLPDSLDAVRKQMRETFRSMTRGRILQPNIPTAFAMIVLNNKWAGKDSMRSRLENMEPVKNIIQKSITKDIISTVLANDGNYVSCGLNVNATRLCADARYGRERYLQGKKLKSASGKKLNAATISFVCPEPSEPNLICQPQRQYQAKYDTQIVEFAALHAFENFHAADIRMTYEEAIVEMFRNHILHGNDLTAGYAGFSSGDVHGVGLRLGFCINEQIEMKDFAGWVFPHEAPKRAWEFPACCGPLCRDTQSFLATIGEEMGGVLWSKREDRNKAPQVYRDRFPRVLERYSPAVRYLGWGSAGIRFPDKTLPAEALLHRRYKFDVGTDKDYLLVKDAVKNIKTEFEVNLWFCRNGRHNHSVFLRERDHVHLATAPMMFIKNSWQECEQWEIENTKNGNIEKWYNGELVANGAPENLEWGYW